MTATPYSPRDESASPQWSRREQLQTILPRLLGPVDEPTLAGIESVVEWVNLKRGDVLFRQGDSGDSLYLIVTGRVCVVRQGRDGPSVIAELSRGESVGEMALITGEARSADIYAMRDSILLRLSREAFDKIVEQCPVLMRSIAKTLIGRLRAADESRAEGGLLRTVAVLPASTTVPAEDFCNRLVMALAPLGSVLHLTSQRVETILGTGAAQSAAGEAQAAALAAWLDEQEAAHRFIVLQCDGDASAWTHRCIRQADRVLVAARADADPTVGAVEQAALAGQTQLTAARRTLVLLHADGSKLPSGTKRWLMPRSMHDHLHVRLDRDGDFARMARALAGRSIGLVLGGGGALGLAELGVIRALEEAGVPIDMVGGTSMGAVISCLHALGHDYHSGLKMNRAAWIDAKPFRAYALPFVSLFQSPRFDGIAKTACGYCDIEDLWLPFFCVSSNLTHSDMKVHRSGTLWRAVRASATIPGVAPPMVDDGDLLVDGGVVNNLPGDVMREQGANTVIVVDVHPEEEMHVEYEDMPSCWQILWSRVLPMRKRINVPSLLSLLVRSTMMSSHNRKKAVHAAADLHFTPPVTHYKLLQFAAMDEIARIGYDYARQYIAQLHSEGKLQPILQAAGVTSATSGNPTATA
ncbi:MAG: cyclic nucleotide-binding and patatin-like phospholipase domain-containing protein [Planctomycetaceae bacterium]|nr:cyclic nucleotide-binding domain-containing protein [Planctomycetaceae bacterium]